MILFIRQFTTLVILCASLSSCNEQSSRKSSNSLWLGVLHASYADIPFRFLRYDSGLVIINSEEQITLNLTAVKEDTLIYSFPHYHKSSLIVHNSSASNIAGVWDSGRRGRKHIPFTASLTNRSYSEIRETTYDDFYDVEFNPEKRTHSTAVGAFRFQDIRSVGTFLTATGDYRHLEGEKKDSTFWLSTFDGSHLYLATGEIEASGLITGKFYSSNNTVKSWVGRPNKNPQIPHADSLTYLLSDTASFSFSTRNFDGDAVQFGQKDFKGNVTIVSVFGSWCPNCHDELRLYAQLYKRLNNDQLRVIPVAFERETNPEKAEKRVNEVFRALDIPFRSYYGGVADKSVASHQFPMLDEVKAFPTSVIIGKDGRVRKIHTGFSGPGTGEIYVAYQKELGSFVENLLAE